MEWSAAYSVGILEIDDQHKELLRLFTLIEDAIAKAQGWSAIHYGIAEVKRFAKFHFLFEEAVMRLFGYADGERHAGTHAHIFRKLEAMERDSLQTHTEEEVLRFLRAWLIDHIQSDDRAYAHYICAGAKVVMPADFSAKLG